MRLLNPACTLCSSLRAKECSPPTETRLKGGTRPPGGFLGKQKEKRTGGRVLTFQLMVLGKKPRYLGLAGLAEP